MRRQAGTSELRALVYMDEIFGYFPPHPANPPTKRPLLTLLKQARSQGVSVVLATQNPVDLDYKGLANIGTWFVGRLQTDRDRDRLRDGLNGAGVEAATVDRLLDAMRNSHMRSSMSTMMKVGIFSGIAFYLPYPIVMLVAFRKQANVDAMDQPPLPTATATL